MTSGAAASEIAVSGFWLWSPIGLLLMLPIPVFVGSMALSFGDFEAVTGHPLFLDTRTRLLSLLSLGVFVVVGLVGRKSGSRALWISVGPTEYRWVERSMRVTAVVTYSAYAIYFINAFLNGLRFDAITRLFESGGPQAGARQYFELTTGVTSWMQLGPILAALIVLRHRLGGKFPYGHAATVVALSSARSLLFSERLALIEVVLAFCLTHMLLRESPPRFVKGLRSLGAIAAALGGLYAIFAIFEYVRSWSSFGRYLGMSFPTFIANRLFSYYATAINNAAGDAYLLDGSRWLGAFFGGGFYRALAGERPVEGAQVFFRLGHFTNTSGLLTPFNAFGILGGLLVVVAMAVGVQVLYRRAIAGSLVGLVGYSVSAIGVLEIVRLSYWSESRFAPVIIGLIGLAFSLSLARWRARRLPSTYQDSLESVGPGSGRRTATGGLER